MRWRNGGIAGSTERRVHAIAHHQDRRGRHIKVHAGQPPQTSSGPAPTTDDGIVCHRESRRRTPSTTGPDPPDHVRKAGATWQQADDHGSLRPVGSARRRRGRKVRRRCGASPARPAVGAGKAASTGRRSRRARAGRTAGSGLGHVREVTSPGRADSPGSMVVAPGSRASAASRLRGGACTMGHRPAPPRVRDRRRGRRAQAARKSATCLVKALACWKRKAWPASP